MRRGLWTLRLDTAIMLRRGFHAPRLSPCSDVETRGFQPSRLGAALVAMISLASGVWILLLDDLSSVIFRRLQSPRVVTFFSLYSSLLCRGDCEGDLSLWVSL